MLLSCRNRNLFSSSVKLSPTSTTCGANTMEKCPDCPCCRETCCFVDQTIKTPNPSHCPWVLVRSVGAGATLLRTTRSHPSQDITPADQVGSVVPARGLETSPVQVPFLTSESPSTAPRGTGRNTATTSAVKRGCAVAASYASVLGVRSNQQVHRSSVPVYPMYDERSSNRWCFEY